MATSLKTIRTKRGTWSVDTNADNIIGNGSYGIVYQGLDRKGRKIAAKRIDTKQKLRLSKRMKDLDKLMELDHPNIVKFHDIYEEEGVVWIFMEFCRHGELGRFFKKKKLKQEQLLTIMKQIAAGIAYLHEHNIIHRDIKPENILVAHAAEIQVKLTDFDLSKFLDEFFDTSAMSSLVGTLAYKAPEFFHNSPDGKLIYHRTVDVYSCGLTFLALDQAQGKEKLSLPQIETPMDGSEFHTRSIGQLTAERMKYKVPELNVVNTDTKSTTSNAAASLDTSVETVRYDVKSKLKELIYNMTQAKPQDRWSAAQVVEALKSIETSWLTYRRQITEETAKKCGSKIQRTISWETGMLHADTMCVQAEQLLVRGKKGQKVYIRVFNRKDGSVIADIKSQCDHYGFYSYSICSHPKKHTHVLEACVDCKQIRSCNMNTGEAQTIYRGPVGIVCPGISNTVLCINDTGHLLQLHVEKQSNELKVVRSVETQLKQIRQMCYIEQYDIVVLACYSPGRIRGVKLGDGSQVWVFKQQIEGKDVDPRGLCHDDEGRIYVTDRYKERLIVLQAQSGELLHVIPLNNIQAVCWSSSHPELTLLDTYGKNVSLYNVLCKCKYIDLSLCTQ